VYQVLHAAAVGNSFASFGSFGSFGTFGAARAGGSGTEELRLRLDLTPMTSSPLEIGLQTEPSSLVAPVLEARRLA